MNTLNLSGSGINNPNRNIIIDLNSETTGVYGGSNAQEVLGAEEMPASSNEPTPKNPKNCGCGCTACGQHRLKKMQCYVLGAAAVAVVLIFLFRGYFKTS